MFQKHDIRAHRELYTHGFHLLVSFSSIFLFSSLSHLLLSVLYSLSHSDRLKAEEVSFYTHTISP